MQCKLRDFKTYLNCAVNLSQLLAPRCDTSKLLSEERVIIEGHAAANNLLKLSEHYARM